MFGKLAELILFGIAPMVFGALLVPAALAQESSVSGEVLYRERIALPPDAVLTVQLADVSLADAPASIIAEQRIEPAGQVPIGFELRFDPAVIRPQVNYAVQARITVNDQLWFINDERYTFDPARPEPLTIMVRRTTQDEHATPTSLFDTTWVLEEIDGSAPAADVRSDMTIAPDGATTGRGGCNRYSGQATIEGTTVAFGKVAATMMACPEPAMNQERQFFDMFEKVASYRIGDGDKLFLVDADGTDLARFSKGE